MRVVDFLTEHAQELVDSDGVDIGTIQTAHTDFATYMDFLQSYGARTFLENGHIIGCAGVALLWEGVGEGWFMGSERMQKNRYSVIRYVRKMLFKHQENGPLRRIHANVRADWPEALRFAEFLGFTKEGLLRKFGPDGKDYYVLGRVK